MSAPVQALIREVAAIVAAHLAATVTVLIAALAADIKKRLENSGENNVQLHSQNVLSKKSKFKNSSLRIVDN